MIYFNRYPGTGRPPVLIFGNPLRRILSFQFSWPFSVGYNNEKGTWIWTMFPFTRTFFPSERWQRLMAVPKYAFKAEIHKMIEEAHGSDK